MEKMKKMKKAFSTLACMDADIDEILEFARLSDIKGVEIRLDKQNHICSLGVEDAALIKKKFAEAGCVITDLATAVSVKAKNSDVLETAKACIDLAAAVDAKAIRIFVGGSIKTFDDTPVHDLDGAAVTVSEMCAYAKARGVEVWAETHSVLSTASALCEFCDRIDSDNLKIIWDVLHSIEFGEPINESLRIIGSRLSHVHLKDAIPPENPKLTQYVHTALGKGSFPIKQLVRLLDGAGYDGYLSLEYELAWRPELKGCYADTNAILAAYNSWVNEAYCE